MEVLDATARILMNELINLNDSAEKALKLYEDHLEDGLNYG